ncbi:hypothetical protein [Aeromonas sp. MdU4]|uniref:hypothetical protein n=1 Tax=Aeromonas sp. MdU4 TaxID=3342819 RepID=UPI0035B92D10
MSRIKLKIWIVLLGWLWLQPLLAQHQLESALPGHDDHHCQVCALHLDGKQALSPAPYCYADKTVDTPLVATMQLSANSAALHSYAIRAPPSPAFLYPFV